MPPFRENYYRILFKSILLETSQFDSSRNENQFYIESGRQHQQTQRI